MTQPIAEKVLDQLQRQSFEYFLREESFENGLVRDKSSPDSPASTAAVGFSLACYPIAVERGFMKRSDARQRAIASTRFFLNASRGEGQNAASHRGFFYHFLDMKTGARVWNSELSTIDTALLLLGMFTIAQYFDGDTAPEREIRDHVDEIWRRMDWQWMLKEDQLLSHGWKPRRGFLKSRWCGYNEGIILYLLGLAAPHGPLTKKSYDACTATYRWRNVFGHEHLYAGPLFIHQYPHAWIDFRGIYDDYMRSKSIDYFENSRRATYVQREYAIRNPRGFEGYCDVCWGFTASDGPGPSVRTVAGRRRRFYGYHARGVPPWIDDGTISPWVTVTSLPFAPEIVLPAMEHFRQLKIGRTARYGYEASFNPTFPSNGNPRVGWVSQYNFAINQGPLVMMVENFRTGLVWRLIRDCRWIKEGLLRAGFRGGWLGQNGQPKTERKSQHHETKK